MERESFIFYRSFYDSIKGLPDNDRKACYDAIFEYALNHKEIELSGVPKAIMTLIKPNLEANYRKYLAGVENGPKGGKFGVLGGRPKKPSSNPVETVTKPTNVDVNDNVDVNGVINPLTRSRSFVVPTIDELKGYIIEKGYSVNPTRFFDFYESKGWMVGKNKMKDWKAAVRNWASEDKVVPQTASLSDIPMQL